MAGILIGRGARFDLWAAAGIGDVQGVRERLEGEAEVLAEKRSDMNPVTVAAFRGHVEALRVLLDAGADPDVPFTIDVAGETVEQWGQPIWLASNRGHYEVAELLLERGARANTAQYASGNGVCWAYQNNHRRLASLMFLHGAVADALSYCLTGDLAALAEHLESRPAESERVLWSAVLAGNEEIVAHHTRQATALPQDDQFRLLREAIRGWRLGNLKIDNTSFDRRAYVRNLERLLDSGFDADLRHSVAPDMNWGLLHHLAASACNPATYGHTEAEVLEFARLLIDAGADVNAIEGQLQSTPLGWAARFGQRALAEYFLARGADPDLAGEAWARPLAWAEREGFGEIAEVLRQPGVTRPTRSTRA